MSGRKTKKRGRKERGKKNNSKTNRLLNLGRVIIGLCYNDLLCHANRSQHKEKVIKEKVKEKMKQNKKLESTQKKQAAERQMESNKYYEAWKVQKDERIRRTKGLYTYNHKPEAIHDVAWCPARSLHGYSKTKHEPKLPVKEAQEGLDEEEDTYSLSFESEASSQQHSSLDESSGSSELTGSVSRASSPSKGRHKTIHVCCQTLHYWCTCDQHMHTHS